jgi:hypothetical protein
VAGLAASATGSADLLSGVERGVCGKDRSGLERVGVVRRFRDAFRTRRGLRTPLSGPQAGGRTIQELWVPAEDLTDFNAYLAGPIQVVREFHAPGHGSLAIRVVEAAAGRGPVDEVLAMLSVAGAKTWIGLDRALRTSAVVYDGEATGPKAGAAGDERLSWLVEACSRDGRRRESAVADPAMGADGLLLPVLVLRAADWVPEVRERARRALAAALRSADTAVLLAAVGVAVAMGSWARGEHALEIVAGALRAAPDEVMAAARRHRDIGVRRLAYRVWLESGRSRHEEVMHAALRERDGICRLLCAQSLTAEAVRDGSVEVLEELPSKGGAKVGIEALAALVKLGRPEAGVAYLGARSAMLRATGECQKADTPRHRAVGRSPRGPQPYRDLPDRPGRGPTGGPDPWAGRRPRRMRHATGCRHAPAFPDAPESPGAGRSRTRSQSPGRTITDMLADPAPVVVRAVKQALRNEP